MNRRRDFIEHALKNEESITSLCRRLGVSRAAAHAWLRLFRDAGWAGLEPRSRRPHRSPSATQPEVVAAVLAARDADPSLGPIRLRAVLVASALGERTPSERTIARILRRAARIRRRAAEGQASTAAPPPPRAESTAA